MAKVLQELSRLWVGGFVDIGRKLQRKSRVLERWIDFPLGEFVVTFVGRHSRRSRWPSAMKLSCSYRPAIRRATGTQVGNSYRVKCSIGKSGQAS